MNRCSAHIYYINDIMRIQYQWWVLSLINNSPCSTHASILNLTMHHQIILHFHVTEVLLGYREVVDGDYFAISILRSIGDSKWGGDFLFRVETANTRLLGRYDHELPFLRDNRCDHQGLFPQL